MRAVFPLLALTACNWVYGLDKTHLPPPDAPYSCADEAPILRGVPVPLIIDINVNELTRSYSISTDRRIAVAVRAGTLYEGPGDAALTTGALLMPPPPSTPASPRLSPEGDELFVRYAPLMAMATIDRYTRQGNLWVHAAQILSITSNTPDISIPTRRSAGPRHMMVLHTAADLREYVEMSPDQWMQVGAPYSPSDLGSSIIAFPNLTTDGLHLVFQGRDATDVTFLYASRASLDDRFAKAVEANPFFGNPRITDSFLVEDCTRMYFSVLNPAGVHYVERD